MYKKYLSFIFILLSAFAAQGASVAADADSAYLSGNYKEAAALYSEIASQQGVSAPLLFNLGNAYLKDGDYGKAMICYQRAKRLDPSNKAIKSNLSYLKEKVEDANKAEQKGKRRNVAEDTPNFMQSVHSAIAEDHSSNLWAGWAAAFFLLFIASAALYLFIGNVLVRKTGFFGGFIFLGLSIIFIVFAYSAASVADEHDYGVVMAYKVKLLTEPDKKETQNETESILTRGTRLRIVAEEINADGEVSWYKVRLNSDYIGWIPAEDLEVI